MVAFMASSGAMKASSRPTFVTPRSFFNWGKSARETETPPPQLQFSYHDVEPPFLMSLVAKTHLRGNYHILLAINWLLRGRLIGSLWLLVMSLRITSIVIYFVFTFSAQ